MEKLNPVTGKPFKKGDTRNDGYRFICYRKTRKIKKNGFFEEEWKRADLYKETNPNQPLISFEEYLRRFRSIHKNKYSYKKSKDSYISGSKKIIVTCLEHGDFLVTPTKHASLKAKSGCPECAKGKSRLTTEDFIRNGVARFGKRYDYSQSKYINAHTPIKISCRKHGLLKNLTPNKHLRRDGGCAKCKGEKAQKKYVMPLEMFLERVGALHPTLDFSNNHQFKNQHDRLTYKCLQCGETRKIRVQDALTNHGCSSESCLSKKLSEHQLYSIEQVISLCHEVHAEGHYSYQYSVYRGMSKGMNIWCNYCKIEFEQTPNAHVHQAQGCPRCGIYIRQLGDFLPNLLKKKIFIEGDFYIFNFYSETESFFKIGISRKTKHRFSPSKTNYDYDLICSLPIGMIEAIKHEQYILDKYKSYQYQPDEYFAGWTECLSVNPLELDVTLAELAKQYDFNSY